MTEIGIRELRSDLSNHIKKAAQGEVVVITVGGEPKAQLVPLPSASPKLTMEEAYATGQVIRAPRRGETPPPPPERKLVLDRPGEDIISDLREERI